jgi:hypothetical protein
MTTKIRQREESHVQCGFGNVFYTSTRGNASPERTRRGFESRTFEDVHSAAAWLAPRVGTTADEIVRAAGQARPAAPPTSRIA